MKLKKIHIKNFRSIREQDIVMSPPCRVLVGINESGKSNILRALSFLLEGKLPSKQDVREILEDEVPIDEAYVEFIFDMVDGEINIIVEACEPLILSKEKDPLILSKAGKTAKPINYSLRKYLKAKTGRYRIDIKNAKKESRITKPADDYSVLPHWRTPSAQCPANYVYPGTESAPINVKKYKFINTKDYPEIPPQYLTEFTSEEFNTAIGQEFKKVIDEALPDCIFWEYDEKNLLPSRIPLAQFTSNPDICMPLKHMFQLFGITDITAAIQEAQQRDKGLKNLLTKIANRTTKHVRDIWQDYKTIEFVLTLNGDHIEAGVKESFNEFGFAQRSDGFKRFVTFLLLISTKLRSGTLSNTVILVDEPDYGIHPTGSGSLRDELIKISEQHNNYVIYSTHSIFMIDTKNTKRHLMVKKEDEITTVTEANESNVVDEEVLYNAIGYSVFHALKKKNLLFEGWRDKQLFKVALESLPSADPLRKKFDNIGICHAKGVQQIHYVTAIMEAGARGCTIISDGDEAANREKKDYEEKLHGYGTWFRYVDVLPQTHCITGEDFVNDPAFIDAIEQLRTDFPQLPATPAQITHPRGKIAALRKWLEDANIAGEDQKKILEKIKSEVFEHLEHENIEEEYFDLMRGISI